MKMVSYDLCIFAYINYSSFIEVIRFVSDINLTSPSTSTNSRSHIKFLYTMSYCAIWLISLLVDYHFIAFLLNQYLIFQRYSDFWNIQMRCFMTSSTQQRPNKLPQIRNTCILNNNCAHCNVPFVLT